MVYLNHRQPAVISITEQKNREQNELHCPQATTALQRHEWPNAQMDQASVDAPNLALSAECSSTILSTSYQGNGLCLGSDQDNNGSRSYLIDRPLQRQTAF